MPDEEMLKPLDNSDDGSQGIGSPPPAEAGEISTYRQRDSLWTNFILAGLFLNVLFYLYYDFSIHNKFSSLLMMIQVCIIVLFFLIRVYPKKVSFAPKDWAVALAGTWLPMLLYPSGNGTEIALFLIIQLLGIIISTFGILSLNSSFAIVPALREVKTGGMYRFMRHPIYFGYFLSFTCMVLQNVTALNIAILCVILGCDIMRIKAEEKILSEDAGYILYKGRVRWRLFPFIW